MSGIDEKALDATLEFEDPKETPAAEPEGTEPAVEEAANPQLNALLAQNAQLAATVTALTEQLGAARTEAQVAAQLREALAKPENKLDEKQQAIKNELEQIVPDLADIGKTKQAVGALAKILSDQMAMVRAERSAQASELTSELMESHGLDPNDSATYRFIENAVVAAIDADASLKTAWNQGRVKRAVTEGFKQVSAKLLTKPGTPRAANKAGAVKAVTQGPRATGGGLGPAGETRAPKVDFKELGSSTGRSKLHDVAFAHLDALLKQQE